MTDDAFKMPKKALQTRVGELQLLVDFAQMDLATTTKTTRRSMLRRLTRLLYPERPRGRAASAFGKVAAEAGMVAVCTGRTARLVDALTDAALPSLQDELLHVLTQVAGDQGIASVDLALTFTSIWAAPVRGPGWNVMALDASTRDLLLYRLMMLIEVLGAQKLGICRSPFKNGEGDDIECGRLFVKVTRKRYCSATCQRRIYMQGYIPRTGRG